MSQTITTPLSTETQNETRRTVKANQRKAGNNTASNGTVPADLHVHRDAIAQHAARKNRLPEACDGTVAPGAARQPHLCEEGWLRHETALLHGDHPDGNGAPEHPVRRQRCRAQVHRSAHAVRQGRGPSLLRSGLRTFRRRGCYGQTTKWYSEVLEEHRRDIMRANV